MPQYKVKPGQKGFYNGRIYDSNGKRPVVVTDTPLKKVPSWLIPVKEEAESVAAARQAAADVAAAEAKNAIEKAKEAQKAAKAAKDAADKQVTEEIPAPPVLTDEVNKEVEEAAVTFTEAPKPSVVETL